MKHRTTGFSPNILRSLTSQKQADKIRQMSDCFCLCARVQSRNRIIRNETGSGAMTAINKCVDMRVYCNGWARTRIKYRQKSELTWGFWIVRYIGSLVCSNNVHVFCVRMSHKSIHTDAHARISTINNKQYSYLVYEYTFLGIILRGLKMRKSRFNMPNSNSFVLQHFAII